jgi:hypothetical protein
MLFVSLRRFTLQHRSQRGHHYYFDPEIGILPYARQPSKTFHFDVYGKLKKHHDHRDNGATVL